MSVYNLIEYGDSFSKTCEILWQYYSDEPNIKLSFLMMLIVHHREKIIGQSGNNRRKDVQIMVPLKYLSIFWGTFEMQLINR